MWMAGRAIASFWVCVWRGGGWRWLGRVCWGPENLDLFPRGGWGGLWKRLAKPKIKLTFFSKIAQMIHKLQYKKCSFSRLFPFKKRGPLVLRPLATVHDEVFFLVFSSFRPIAQVVWSWVPAPMGVCDTVMDLERGIAAFPHSFEECRTDLKVVQCYTPQKI